MGSRQQLLDLLTAHISLYHSQTPRPPLSNTNPRAALLRWFSALSVHQRRAHLTVVDANFVAILIQMREKLASQGPGRFIVLPDLPQNDNPTLPTLCYRKSEGLLSRLSEFNCAERAIRNSVELFSSIEGEEGKGGGVLSLDAACVSEGLVEDVSRFVGVMDEVTNGEFLRGGEEGEMATEWAELLWLKAKGYYSLEEFVVNRMEVALRLAWLNSNSVKKRGAKLKDRLNAASVAANLFWRKKGCVDWWDNLDSCGKKDVYCTYLGKAARSLIANMVKGKHIYLYDKILCYHDQDKEAQRSGPALRVGQDIVAFKGTDLKITESSIHAHASGIFCSLESVFNSLYILQVISTMYSAAQFGACDKESLFFSSLDCVNSISDIILRKLRDVLMAISLDCTKRELLGEGTTKPIKTKLNEKHVASKRKKKGKKKRANPMSRSCQDDSKPSLPMEGKGDREMSIITEDVAQSDKFDSEVPRKDPAQESLLSEDAVEPVKGANKGKSRGAPRKSRKERKKIKSTGSNIVKAASCQSRCSRTAFVSTGPEDVCSMCDCASANSTSANLSIIAVGHIGEHDANVCCSNISSEDVVKHQENASAQTDNHLSLKNYPHLDSTGKIDAETTRSGSLKCNPDHCVQRVEPLVEYDNRIELGSGNHVTGYSVKQMKDGEPEAKSSPVKEQRSMSILRVGTLNSPAYVSYEWPNVTPYHSPTNTHLPAATDRLHLDIGYNLQSHFRHSFVQTLPVRNSPIDSAYSGILPTPLPMSLDWPPAVHGVNRMVPSVTCNYDSEFISRRQSSFHRSTVPSMQCGAATSEDERTISGEQMDFPDGTSLQEQMDEHDKHWMSEEELEAHAYSAMDYSQCFGGGVMYWNPSDHPGTSFSRPPSLCSDDSSWAWREADMNRAVDDMVAFSSSYSTNGLTSPSTASFCSPFDSLAPGTLGYVMPGSEISNKVLHSSSTMTDLGAEESASGSISNFSCDGEVKTGDSLPCPILRPIIIPPNMTRDRSKRVYDRKSPCVPPSRREHSRIKRPPSPVVLCVSNAPRPPPPSPVGDSRKHRGFPTVRSGSSSPRNWGVKGWFHDGVSIEEACMPLEGNEVVWPSWRNKSLSARQLTQPLPGKLLQDRLIAISQLARDQEHPDVTFPLHPPESQNCAKHKVSLSLMHDILHDEIGSFCNQVAAENLIRKPYINWAVKRVARSLQVLWPRSRTNVYGSNATGLSLPSSDVDLVVSLPPVRNLEPIKEAGILEGRNGIKETCLQHAARYLANQEWVKSDSLKIVENTAIPIIMLVVEVPRDLISTLSNDHLPKEEADPPAASEEGNHFQTDVVSSEVSNSPKWSKPRNYINDGFKSVRLDISFKSPTHTGLQTTALVKDLTERFPAVTPLALVLKQFLADRSLDQSYSGGLSSYCLILLITRFLQHEHHHGRPINQNYGSLLMDFFYFFGNVFDPRQMRISVQGSGVYLNRERGCSIDPLCIDDPLFLTNNVGRNCFRIHQCIKAFADAYSMLEDELTCFDNDEDDGDPKPACKLLPKLIPSIGHLVGP